MVKHLDNKTTKVGENDIHYLTGGTGKALVVIHGGGRNVHTRKVAEFSEVMTDFLD